MTLQPVARGTLSAGLLAACLEGDIGILEDPAAGKGMTEVLWEEEAGIRDWWPPNEAVEASEVWLPDDPGRLILLMAPPP